MPQNLVFGQLWVLHHPLSALEQNLSTLLRRLQMWTVSCNNCQLRLVTLLLCASSVWTRRLTWLYSVGSASSCPFADMSCPSSICWASLSWLLNQSWFWCACEFQHYFQCTDTISIGHRFDRHILCHGRIDSVWNDAHAQRSPNLITTCHDRSSAT